MDKTPVTTEPQTPVLTIFEQEMLRKGHLEAELQKKLAELQALSVTCRNLETEIYAINKGLKTYAHLNTQTT